MIHKSMNFHLSYCCGTIQLPSHLILSKQNYSVLIQEVRLWYFSLYLLRLENLGVRQLFPKFTFFFFFVFQETDSKLICFDHQTDGHRK